MPYKDPEVAKLKAAERGRRWRARNRAVDWLDTRGRHGNHARGPKHPRWSDEKIISDEGYVKVRVGCEHPLADPNGYAYEHLVVWASAGNPLPGPGELLHHKDENRQNNRIGNLELKTRSAHGSAHIASRERDTLGRLLPKAAGRLLDGREWNEMPEVKRG